jgi:hypothetical protein
MQALVHERSKEKKFSLKQNSIHNFFFFRIGGVESNWVHSARRTPTGLLYLPRVIMRVENLVEWWLAGETEVLGENLPQCHFVHHKSHMTWPGATPGRRGGKPTTNCLSYGTAILNILLNSLCFQFQTATTDHFYQLTNKKYPLENAPSIFNSLREKYMSSPR